MHLDLCDDCLPIQCRSSLRPLTGRAGRMRKRTTTHDHQQNPNSTPHSHKGFAVVDASPSCYARESLRLCRSWHRRVHVSGRLCGCPRRDVLSSPVLESRIPQAQIDSDFAFFRGATVRECVLLPSSVSCRSELRLSRIGCFRPIFCTLQSLLHGGTGFSL